MKKERNLGIDLVKIIACIGVVLLHTIGFNSSKWNNLIYYAGTISVPLFFMANGYFILNKDEISFKYLIKKILRLILIASIWNIVYFAILYILNGTKDNIFMLILKSLLEKGNITWFWFLGALIILYLLTPILHKILQSKKINKVFLLTMILICESIYIFNAIRGFNGDKIIKQLILQTLRIWTWITYFYLGGYVKDNFKWKKSYNYLLLGLSAFCICYEFIVANKIIHNLYAENFYDNIFIMIWVIIMFNFIKNLNINEKYRKIITDISSLTLGIYIIHGFLFKYINSFYDFTNGLINITIFIFVLIVSCLISYIIKKIPYVKNIIT